jgi:predicted ATP-grasp superfamily ATP-dependent carboligase
MKHASHQSGMLLTTAKPDRLVILGMNLTALAVARSARAWGIEPCVVDTIRGPARKSRLAKCLLAEGRARASLLPRVVDLGMERASWLVSTADAWSSELIDARPMLESAFARLLQPRNDALAICLSKKRFAQWCAASQMPAPRYYAVDMKRLAIEGEVSFPLFVRPATTQHAAPRAAIPKAREVQTPGELQVCLSAFRDEGVEPVVCESLLGRRLAQISVGVAMTPDREMTLVARKVRPVAEACRVGTLVEAIADPAAEALALLALRKLRYEGIAEVEILKDLDTRQMFIVEVNARPWIQFGLAAATGRDLLGFFFTDGPPAVPQRSAVWLDFSADLWNCFNREDGLVRKGRVSFRDYCRSLARANVYARWAVRDPGPSLADAVSLTRTAVSSLVLRRHLNP